MTDHVGQALTQPLRDVNLKKDDIPVRLERIQDDPYSLVGVTGCRKIVTEIASLYPMLGPDVNEVELQSDADKREAGFSRVAGGIIGGLIPFRGVVREITGANASERAYLSALSAGFARRSFLKGIAVSQGCIAPPPPLELKLSYDFNSF